jgi:hypothetical protein
MYPSYYRRNSIVAIVAGFALASVAVAQTQPATPAQSQPTMPAQSQKSESNPPSQMSTTAPSKSDTAVSAFQKLDAAKAGYVTKEQAAKLNGFDFTQADKNKDGKLDRDEFNAAWGVYSKPQS